MSGSWSAGHSTETHARPRAARGAGLLVVVCVALTLGAASFLGVRLVPVLTGSMTPWAPAGSLVLTLPASGTEVAEGDVVAFRPPAPWSVQGDRPVLHRVSRLGSDGAQPWMTTRGDANPGEDPWKVQLGDADLGRATLVVPHVGRLLAGGPFAALGLVLGSVALLAALALATARPAPCTCTPDDHRLVVLIS